MLRGLSTLSALRAALSTRLNASGIEKLRNLGIAAHIDSGKTTVSERLLFYSGKIEEIHEVKGKDKVGATMDHMELERERGITIQSAATSFNWKDHAFNLIDTPGHVDFTVEVERSLRVLDGAVLVVCASGGIQSQTITVHRQMNRYDIPTIAFINKLDRLGANPVRCLAGIRERLGRCSAFLQLPIGLENNCQGLIDLIEERAVYFDGSSGENVRYDKNYPADMKDLVAQYRQDLIETLADCDDEIGEIFLMEETPTVQQISDAIRRATISLKFTPVMMGTALKNKGVQELMDATIKYLPDPSEVVNKALITDKKATVQYDDDGEPIILEPERAIMNPTIVREEMDKLPGVGLAFKLDTTAYGQLTYIRMYQGKFSKGDSIINTRTGERIRVSKMVKMHSNKMDPTDKLVAGDIAGFFGIDCASGDTFVHQTALRGGKVLSMESIFVPNPVVSLSIEPKNKNDADTGARFRKALIRFSKEDPTFIVKHDEETDEIIISGMGELHLEVYGQRMEREYNCPVILGRPKVLWYEALIADAKFDYTHKRQTGGRGQFGRAMGKVFTSFDPKLANLDVTFKADLVGNDLSRGYVKPLEKGMRAALAAGNITGSRVVGFHILLEDGAEHQVDSSEHAFFTCGEGCMEQAIKNSALKLLGPFMKVEVACPVEFREKVIQLISLRYGEVKETFETFDFITFQADVLLYDMFGFTQALRANTEGKGEYTMEFLRYDYVRDELEEDLHQEWLEETAEKIDKRKGSSSRGFGQKKKKKGKA